MPKYHCDYCNTFLTHDSPSVRKTHCQGRKHKDNVKFYYQQWMEEQTQNFIDATTAAYKAGMIGKRGVNMPPSNMDPVAPQMAMTFGSVMMPEEMYLGSSSMIPMPPLPSSMMKLPMRPPEPLEPPPMMPPLPRNKRPSSPTARSQR